MSNTGFKLKNASGVATDLINLYDSSNVTATTQVTKYKSMSSQTDLGSIFTLYANLGTLGIPGYRGLPCGFKLSDGTDIGKLFVQKNFLKYHYRFNSGDINGSNMLANYASGVAVYDAPVTGGTINTTLQKFGTGCLYLNGTNQFVTLPNFTSDLNGISIACWVKTDSFGYTRIVEFGNSLVVPLIENKFLISTAWGVEVRQPGVDNYNNPGDLGLNSNSWSHIVWTMSCTDLVNKKGTWNIYIGGILLYSVANFFYPNPVSRTNNWLGKGFTDLFNGYMDEFRYYTKVLSADEVAYLYAVNNTAPFTSKSINGLSLWLDANDTATITKNVSNSVTLWTDKSGNNRDAVNVGTSNVTYNSTGFNSKPAIELLSTGPSDGITKGTDLQAIRAPIPNATFSNGVTFFVVYQKTGVANTFEGLISRTSANNELTVFDIYNQTRAVGNATSRGTFTSSLDLKTSTSLNILSSVVNTNVWNEFKNGTLQTKSSLVNVGNYADSAQYLYLGTRAGNTTQFTGVISEVIVYNSVLSDANRQSVEGYLAWK